MNVTGLAAWLAGTGDTSYTVQGIQSSDSATTFSDVQLINGVNNVGTLTNSTNGPGAVGGATTLSSEFSFDQLSFDVDDRVDTQRGTLSGIILTSVSAVPEPSSTFFAAAVLGLGALRRKRK